MLMTENKNPLLRHVATLIGYGIIALTLAIVFNPNHTHTDYCYQTNDGFVKTPIELSGWDRVSCH